MPVYYNPGPQRYAESQQNRMDNWIRQMLQMFMMKQQQGREDTRWEREQGQKEKYQQGILDYYEHLKKPTSKEAKVPEWLAKARIIAEQTGRSLGEIVTQMTLGKDTEEKPRFTPYQQYQMGKDKSKWGQDILSSILKGINTTIEQRSRLYYTKEEMEQDPTRKELLKTKAYLIKTYKAKTTFSDADIEDILKYADLANVSEGATDSNLIKREDLNKR